MYEWFTDLAGRLSAVEQPTWFLVMTAVSVAVSLLGMLARHRSRRRERCLEGRVVALEHARPTYGDEPEHDAKGDAGPLAKEVARLVYHLLADGRREKGWIVTEHAVRVAVGPGECKIKLPTGAVETAEPGSVWVGGEDVTRHYTEDELLHVRHAAEARMDWHAGQDRLAARLGAIGLEAPPADGGPVACCGGVDPLGQTGVPYGYDRPLAARAGERARARR